MTTNEYLIGVDVGGTFTDVIAFAPAERLFQVAKVPTSVEDPSIGVLRGLKALGITLDSVEVVIHGTTVGTNAVLQRRGARCGLITTRGFRDILELGRRTRPHLFGLDGTFEPIIPRDLRFEVTERIDADGNIVVPLDHQEVREAVRALLARGVEAVVIHFLHSYRNPVHEQACSKIVAELWPNKHVSVGSDILREVREFERGSTAAVNAYIQPIISRYVGRLRGELKRQGLRTDLLIMQGNGGMMSAAIAAEHAVQTVMSGPAAGAISAARIGAQAGFSNVISCDMGGTSFDVATISGGHLTISAEKDVCYNVPVRVPMIDVHTIGAGGGSIARIDRAGILRVGPESAGAWPGPICYGRGGEEPTVSDAQFLLGRLDASAIVGMDSPTAVEQVRAIVATKIARPLGLSIEQAALAIIRVADAEMASAIRLVSIECGHDPRDFALLTFGGAGPLHAVSLARELGIPTVIIPPHPGLVSALGCIVADVRHDFAQNFNRPMDELGAEEAATVLDRQEEAGRARIDREHVTVSRIDVVREADMLFSGQTHSFRIPLDRNGFDCDKVLRDFRNRYAERFSLDLPEMRPVLGNLRTTVLGRRSPIDLALLWSNAPSDSTRVRRVAFGPEFIETPILERESLPLGASISGPAIIEQMDSTTVIEPGSTAKVDPLGNLLIAVQLTKH